MYPALSARQVNPVLALPESAKKLSVEGKIFSSRRPERLTISGYGAKKMHTGLGFITFASGQPE